MDNLLLKLRLKFKSVVRGVERQDYGVGHTDDLKTKMLCNGDVTMEAWVGIQFLPTLRVEDGVIMIRRVIWCIAEPVVRTSNLNQWTVR